MNGSPWGQDGPPPEAYSRVTDPERFAPLLDFAASLVDRLASEFDVERAEGTSLEPRLKPEELARPSVLLTPRTAEAAPLLISFTTPPSLVVRAGRWFEEPVPICTCDACAETALSAVERLTGIVDPIVAGRFREWISLPPLVGSAWHAVQLGGATGNDSARRSRLSRAEARAKLRGGPRRYDWQPWPRRAGA